jgi:uncharacterized membrane protein
LYPSVLKKNPTTFPEFSLNVLLIRFSALLISGIWIFGFLSPILINLENPFTQFIFERIYSRVCHQDINKCVTVHNSSMLVCARCTGIYLGAFLTGIIFLSNKSLRINLYSIIVMSLPLMLDVLFITTGIYPYTKSFAFITGLLFGGMLYLVTISELENYLSNKNFRGNE